MPTKVLGKIFLRQSHLTLELWADLLDQGKREMVGSSCVIKSPPFQVKETKYVKPLSKEFPFMTLSFECCFFFLLNSVILFSSLEIIMALKFSFVFRYCCLRFGICLSILRWQALSHIETYRIWDWEADYLVPVRWRCSMISVSPSHNQPWRSLVSVNQQNHEKSLRKM